MSPFLKSPVQSLKSAFAGAVRRSLPSNWFLGGKDGPYRGRATTISDPYEQSTWVYSALRTIAQPLRSASLVFADEHGARVEDQDLARFWARPARGVHEALGFGDFVETSLAIRGVAGSVFWILDGSWLMRTASLHEPILVAAPSQMTPVWAGRRLDGWIYRDGGGRHLALLREQVIHLRYPNPGDPDSLDGIAPWMPARPSAEAARAGQIFARRMMDRNGDAGKLLIGRQSLTPVQMETLRAELREKRRAAESGEYRDTVIGGDFEVHESPINAINSDFAKQLEMSRDEIYVAYGVPPSMGAQTASYSVGAASDWYRLITGTCAAEADCLGEAIARVSEIRLGWRGLLGERGRGERSLTASFDFSNHPVMAEVRAARVSQLKELTLIGVPVREGNEFLRLGLPEYKGWEERLLPLSLQPVESAAAPPAKDDPSLNKGAARGLDGVEDLVGLWSARRGALAKQRQSEARKARWARVDKAREADRKRVAKILSRHLMTARAETLANLKTQYQGKAWGEMSEYAIRAGVLELVFDLPRWFGGLWTDLSRALGGIFMTAGEQAAKEIADIAPQGDFDPLTETDPRVVEELARRQNLIKGATAEMHAEVVASLEEGLQAGETLDQLTARVREVFNGMDRTRAQTIARTETGAAYETARFHTFKAAGITQKGWLSGGDDGVTRDTHMAADGQRRGIDELFEVGEARLLHPHDQVNGAGFPGELINCRCVLTAEG